MTDEIEIFDRHAVRAHRARAAGRLSGLAPILREAGERLLDRLDDTTRKQFTAGLDIGGRGVVAPLMRARGIDVTCLDAAAPMLAGDARGVVGEADFLPFAPGSFDLIVACLSLHWINDLPGALLQIRQALRPGGFFIASLPVLPTLAPLREALMQAECDLRGGASMRVSPFPELRDCAGLLQRAGFTLPVADADEIYLRYATPLGLLRDLQAAGESNALCLRDKSIPPRALFAQALASLAGDDGAIDITLHIATMSGWRAD